MWNLEKLLSVLVPSEKSLAECQNYATTLWNAGSKGKLCYQHPALTENKNMAEITSKSHSNEVRGMLIWQKSNKVKHLFGKMDRYIWTGAKKEHNYDVD